MKTSVAHLCLQGASSAPQPPTTHPTHLKDIYTLLLTYCPQVLDIHAWICGPQTERSECLQLFLVSNTSTKVFLSFSTLLMKKIASPSMYPPPLLHLLPPLLPLLCPHVGGHWNNWKGDWEQQLLSEDKPRQISGGWEQKQTGWRWPHQGWKNFQAWVT